MIEIREARPSEYHEVAALTLAAYREVFGDDGMGDYADEIVDTAGHARSAVVLVALEDGRPVGTATYVRGPGPLADGDDPDGAWIRFLAVAPEAQGRGIGRALTEACLTRARDDRRAGLHLFTSDLQAAAQRM